MGKKIVQKYWPGAVAVVAMSRNRVAKKAQGGTETIVDTTGEEVKILRQGEVVVPI